MARKHSEPEIIEDDQTISVYDAALIWRDSGRDEDYTCGYSEEELEDALD